MTRGETKTITIKNGNYQDYNITLELNGRYLEMLDPSFFAGYTNRWALAVR